MENTEKAAWLGMITSPLTGYDNETNAHSPISLCRLQEHVFQVSAYTSRSYTSGNFAKCPVLLTQSDFPNSSKHSAKGQLIV